MYVKNTEEVIEKSEVKLTIQLHTIVYLVRVTIYNQYSVNEQNKQT